MKKIIRFTRFFLPAAVLSIVLIAAGIAGYFAFDGFNLGLDFKGGLVQEVQFAPRAFSLSYEGPGNAVVSLNSTSLTVAISGAGVQGQTYQYLISDYGTLGAFVQSMSQIEGITINSPLPGSTPYKFLILDTQSNPVLGPDPYWIHYLSPGAQPIPIGEVRDALEGLGTPAVQQLGSAEDLRFMIRMDDAEEDNSSIDPKDISKTLELRFGEGEVAVTSSSFMGSRFSKDLTSQAALLLLATLGLILIYASIRFKPQYAIGAVLAILHDGLIIVAFVVWTRMEFNTLTIAAVLTILGYSINDTIVIFDRMRENKHIYPNESMADNLDRSITETLSRTFITTLTTMLAVLSLYIFTTGSMKDFALALLVGMISGVYSTIYIASGFVLFWDRIMPKERKKEPAGGTEAAAET